MLSATGLPIEQCWATSRIRPGAARAPSLVDPLSGPTSLPPETSYTYLALRKPPSSGPSKRTTTSRCQQHHTPQLYCITTATPSSAQLRSSPLYTHPTVHTRGTQGPARHSHVYRRHYSRCSCRRRLPPRKLALLGDTARPSLYLEISAPEAVVPPSTSSSPARVGHITG